MLRDLALVFATVTLGACLRPALVECGELACAPAQVCHADRCLDPSLLEACESPIAEGTCDALGEPGHCIDGVCELATCGDGYVDSELREECDGSIPDAHCIDYGFDLGRPACAACQPDATMGCERFGWERIIDAPTLALWTDGETFAYVTTPGLHVVTPTDTTFVPGAFAGVWGGGGHVIGYHPEAFVDVFGGVATMRDVVGADHARVGPDGTIYVLEDCQVSIVEPTRIVTFGPPIGQPSCGRIEVGPPGPHGPRIYVTAGDPFPDRVYRWDQGRGMFLGVRTFPGGVTNMRFGRDRLWVTNLSGAYTIDDDDQFVDLDIGFGPSSIAFSADATFVGDNGGRAARIRGSRIQLFHAPGQITGDDAVYSYRGPIYRFKGIEYGIRAALSSQLEVVSSLQEADGTVIAATKRALHVAGMNGGGWTQKINPASLTRAFAGASARYFVSDFATQAGARDPKLHATTSGLDGVWTQITVPMSPLLYGLWWSPSDSTLFAVGDNDAGDAFFGVRRGNMWETAYRTGCTMRGVHGTDASHVIAVGGCNGQAVVWTYDGTQLTERARPDLPGPLLAALRFPDGQLVAAGASGAARFDGTTWSIDETIIGEHLSGTSASDVWVSGTFTSVQHFDGTVWSKLAVQASGTIAVTAEPDRVLFPGATDGFVELVR